MTVTVRPADDGGALVTVRDTGPGMTAGQRGQATERFWRAPDAQNVDGAGLGLSIVAVLVEASGGRLTLTPAPSPDGPGRRLWLPTASPSGSSGRRPGAGRAAWCRSPTGR